MVSRAGLGPTAVVWKPCSKTSQLTDCRKYQITIVTSVCEWIANVISYSDNKLIRSHDLYYSCE